MKSVCTLATTIYSDLLVEPHQHLPISMYQLIFTLTRITALLKFSGSEPILKALMSKSNLSCK